jgi:hypothetical protein
VAVPLPLSESSTVSTTTEGVLLLLLAPPTLPIGSSSVSTTTVGADGSKVGVFAEDEDEDRPLTEDWNSAKAFSNASSFFESTSMVRALMRGEASRVASKR